jgi:16S rRNA (cytosine967-C5)-methyltransferase
MAVRQAAILDTVADAPKPGGRIVYATCSLLPDENCRIVDAFLERRRDYELLPVSRALESMRVDADLSTLRTRLGETEVLELAPNRHNTDAFFGAILRRREA